jgi:hypothetical protein
LDLCRNHLFFCIDIAYIHLRRDLCESFMKYTNKLNLPQPIVDAVINDKYSKGAADISVTELMDPPQMRDLKKRYENKIIIDVSDQLYALYGQIIHKIFEVNEKEAVAERRLSIEVGGWSISGGMDRYTAKEGLLQDYKFTTVYKVKKGEAPEEWVRQLNVYAEILRQNGEKVINLEIVALFRDWSKLEASRDENYPQYMISIVEIPLIDSKEVMKYIESQVRLHQDADKGTYIPCSKEERWAKDDSYAIMKEGNDRAYRVCASKEAAQLVMSGLGVREKEYSIELRKGESVRCKNYCVVKDFCVQYSKEKIKG